MIILFLFHYWLLVSASQDHHQARTDKFSTFRQVVHTVTTVV